MQVKPKTIPWVCTDLERYLEANGFTNVTESGDDRITFTGFELSIMIKSDRVDFVQYFDGDEERNPDMQRFATYVGISSLGLFEWMLLLHISKVIPLKNFLGNVKLQTGSTTVDMLKDLFSHFKVTADPNAVPLNY